MHLFIFFREKERRTKTLFSVFFLYRHILQQYFCLERMHIF